MAAQEQMNDILIIASKEFKDYLKSKRFILVASCTPSWRSPSWASRS